MHRSGSSSRVSDEFFSSSPESNNNKRTSLSDSEDEQQQQQQLLPISSVVKKEKIRGVVRSAETAVHIIPLLLILSALILWFYSTPVDMAAGGSDSFALGVRI